LIEKEIKILLVEDNQADVILIKRYIEKILTRPLIYQVSNFDEFVTLLGNFRPDILISDYRLGPFTGLEVLSYVQRHRPDLPFIFVTNSVETEEIAENTILSTVTDFILKNNIKVLHKRLLPHFEKIAKQKQHKKLPPGHREQLDQMRSYMKDIEDLEKLKNQNKNKK